MSTTEPQTKPLIGQSRSNVGLGAWIPSEERMPESGQTILGFWDSLPLSGSPISGKNFGVATKTGRVWHNPVDESEEYCSPTYWMPLPEAPNVI